MTKLVDLVGRLDKEADQAAEQAQYELDHDDPDGAAATWAVLAVERRLAWLGVVLAPSPSRLDPVREPVDPEGPRPPSVGEPGYG